MGLLQSNPQKRFTLADAQQHVWFQRSVQEQAYYLQRSDHEHVISRQSQVATQPASELAHRLTQSLRDSGDMNILEPGTFEGYVYTC
jgi:hypothetical protein